MIKLNIEKPITSLSEWKSVVFPVKSSLSHNEAFIRRSPTEIAVRLANKSIENLKKV
jgi:hypothetical protein